MKTSFDIGEFLEEKDLDITGKTYKDIFPLSFGAEAEDLTSKFLYAVVEILLDFINQTNDRDASVLDFHHPSQITKGRVHLILYCNLGAKLWSKYVKK